MLKFMYHCERYPHTIATITEKNARLRVLTPEMDRLTGRFPAARVQNIDHLVDDGEFPIRSSSHSHPSAHLRLHQVSRIRQQTAHQITSSDNDILSEKRLYCRSEERTYLRFVGLPPPFFHSIFVASGLFNCSVCSEVIEWPVAIKWLVAARSRSACGVVVSRVDQSHTIQYLSI